MPMAIPAAIGGVASIAGTVIANKGAKNAAKTAAQTAADNRAFATDQYNIAKENYNPYVSQGTQATGAISGLLGLGGDPAAQEAAFKQYQDSTGYKSAVRDGLNAINTNAYASGLGDSGATVKALQTRGQELADQSFNDYYNKVQGQQGVGLNALGNLTNLQTGLTNTVIGQNDSAGAAKVGQQIAQSNNTGALIKDLANLGASTVSKYTASKQKGVG